MGARVFWICLYEVCELLHTFNPSYDLYLNVVRRDSQVSCEASGVLNFEEARRFLEHLWTPDIPYKIWDSYGGNCREMYIFIYNPKIATRTCFSTPVPSAGGVLSPITFKTRAVSGVLLLWLLKVIWLSTPPEDGTGVPKHVQVASSLMTIFTQMVHSVGK
jgi:hypothetical protein